jgi:catechol 2,3-dioxygenase-like lactoylglutathione lyase family enzyme
MTLLSPLRRTTIFVNDMERSLELYRDVLGMTVFYDQVIAAPETAQFLGVPGARTRVVSLQGGDTPFGMVGLVSFLHPDIAPRRQLRASVEGPDLLFLFTGEIDIRAVHTKVAEAGHEILCEPLAYEVPERGVISGFTCVDDNDVVVAVMRFGGLDEPGGTRVGPMRRVSIIVDDMEASLAFYRDTMGLRVFYDQEITSPEEGMMLGLPGAKVRVVSLQSGDSDIGMVGLVEVREPGLPPKAPVRESVGAPDAALVFVTESMHSMHEKVTTAGVRLQTAPLEYEIPQRGICAGMSFYDPSGLLMDITQLAPLSESR